MLCGFKCLMVCGSYCNSARMFLSLLFCYYFECACGGFKFCLEVFAVLVICGFGWILLFKCVGCA